MTIRSQRSWGQRVFQRLTVVLTAAVALYAQDTITLVGSGSNLPRPLYDAWVDAFNQHSAKTHVRYLPLGTSVSIQQITSGNGDFGGGEVPLTPELVAGARVRLTDIPVALVAVVPIYNLPGLAGSLRFTGSVLANIFLGKIRNWNDPEIASLNPGIKLPAVAIAVFHRADGKGANYILSDYLSKVSPTFRDRIGRSASPKWLLGRSAMRNEDMVEQVANTSGALGYIEANYAAAGVGVGSVQNAAGHFVRASPDSIASACKAVIKTGTRDLQVSLINAPGAGSYPLSSFTYMYLSEDLQDKVRARELASFVDFVLQQGQSIATSKNYAPLPAPVLREAQARVRDWAKKNSAGR